MEASRYLLPVQGDPGPRSPLLIGVSVSGEVSRTVEALRRGGHVGALTCAVTGDAGSRAGQAADRLVEVKLPPGQGGGHVPGTRSYTASLLALYLLSFHMAEVRDRLSVEQTNAMGQQLLRDADTIGTVVGALDDPMAAAAERWADMGSCVVLGAGPNLATAQFMAAKIIEATGLHASASDLEEWAHLHYFVSDPSQVIIAVLPHGAQSSRAVELIDLMRRRGRRVMVITTADSPLAVDREDVVIAAEELVETTSPFTLHAGTALFAAHLAEVLEVEYFNGFPPDPEPEGNTIVRSAVVDEPEGPDEALVPAP
jgi:glutamine---fructose-6-phosphate transaminase (isomerizing)